MRVRERQKKYTRCLERGGGGGGGGWVEGGVEGGLGGGGGGGGRARKEAAFPGSVPTPQLFQVWSTCTTRPGRTFPPRPRVTPNVRV